MEIREARDDDVPDLQAIYAHHVLHGTGTFEEEPPPVEEMAARFHEVVDQGFQAFELQFGPQENEVKPIEEKLESGLKPPTPAAPRGG